MKMQENCRLGRDLLLRLEELEKPQYWLVEEVTRETGRYFDRPYLSKIKKGRLRSETIVRAICQILDMPCLPEYIQRPVQ